MATKTIVVVAAVVVLPVVVVVAVVPITCLDRRHPPLPKNHTTKQGRRPAKTFPCQ